VKRVLPMILTLISGSTVLADYFWDSSLLSGVTARFLAWSVLISSFATGLGGANLLAIHWRNVRVKKSGWGLSAVLIVSLLAWLCIGIGGGTSSPLYRFIWQNVYSSLSATLFALNAFFIASAAYRSFRVRNVDSSLLLIAAAIVMLGRVGLGEVLYRGMPQLADWLMKVPGTGGMRGITMGGALGAVTIGIRTILGLERSGAAGLTD